MNNKVWLVLLLVAGILLSYSTMSFHDGMLGYYGNQRGWYFGRMMGGGGGMMGGYSGQYSIVDDKTAEADMSSSLSNAAVDKTNNTVTYSGKNVKIVMLAGPEAADEKFVVGGLVNPTLKISKGANVILEMINEDEGMPHGVVVTETPPPYADMAMMQVNLYPGAIVRPVPRAKDGKYPKNEAFFKADQPGTYYYLCQYPGHAEEGMYGKFIIE